MSRTTRTNAINRKTLIPCQHVNSVNESKAEWLLPVLQLGKAKFETNSSTGWKGMKDSPRELHLQMMLIIVSARERERVNGNETAGGSGWQTIFRSKGSNGGGCWVGQFNLQKPNRTDRPDPSQQWTALKAFQLWQ